REDKYQPEALENPVYSPKAGCKRQRRSCENFSYSLFQPSRNFLQHNNVGSILGASQQIGDKTNVTNSDTSLTIVSASTRAMAVLISQLRPCRATTHREFLLELTCSAGLRTSLARRCAIPA